MKSITKLLVKTSCQIVSITEIDVSTDDLKYIKLVLLDVICTGYLFVQERKIILLPGTTWSDLSKLNVLNFSK